LSAIEAVVADKANHCPDLGGRATTRKVTDAVIAELKNPASASHLQEVVATGV
jgi:tartrate dehydrogenase/decarboxylase / D-malate dehydrogenase